MSDLFDRPFEEDGSLGDDTPPAPGPLDRRVFTVSELTAKIRNAIEGAAQAGIKLRMENPVVSQDRAACTITCEFPDGRRLVSNTIYDLKDGKIVRQFDVQVMDPEG